YDTADNLLSASRWEGVALLPVSDAFSYNSLHQVTSRVSSLPDVVGPAQSLAYRYDAAGNPPKILDESDGPATAQIVSAYDDVNRLSERTLTARPTQAGIELGWAARDVVVSAARSSGVAKDVATSLYRYDGVGLLYYQQDRYG